jgi:hypothetical protein
MVTIYSGKPNWPLLTLAGLSFLPGIGFVVGCVAVTWALISSRSRARLALVIAGTGILANVVLSVAVYQYAMNDPDVAAVRRELVGIQLAVLVESLEAHRVEHGAYPEKLTDLARSGTGGILDVSGGISTSRKPFQYEVMPDGEHYGLFAVGADGEPRTDDDIVPQLDDSVRARSGWVPNAP